jgi:hypothetical protein
MSLPVSACLLSKACESEQAYQRVLTRLKFNAQCGAFTLWPCHHQPRCPTPEVKKIEALVRRLKADLLKKE